MNAEQIAETLNVARSNVSTSIRELESWGIIHPRSCLGDRREHYESLKDVSEMFVRIMELRKRANLTRRCNYCASRWRNWSANLLTTTPGAPPGNGAVLRGLKRGL